nr:chymotrypsin-like protease CTRL-1 [Aedes albopictus]
MKICNSEQIGEKLIISVCCPTTLNDKLCGKQPQQHRSHKISKRIFNGEKAEQNQFPWMVLLKNKKGGFFCGGTLITNRFVLTVAHCVLANKIKFVTLGNINISKNNDHHLNDKNGAGTDKPQNIEVNEVIIHPEYKSRRKLNDIAILRLEKEVSFSESRWSSLDCYRTCICMNVSFCTPFQVFDQYAFPAGGDSSCPRFHPDSALLVGGKQEPTKFPIFNVAVKLDETYVCTAGANQGNHCNGDSGGPLQYKSKLSHRFVQHGVVSFGVAACEKPELPGVYTRVDQFASWIHQVVYGG